MSGLTSRFSKLNPFSKVKTDDEDKGEALAPESIAGGGHSAQRTVITKEQLRVSHAVKKFLVDQHILGEHDVALDSDETTPALKEFLDKPHINVPHSVCDRSHPLTEYFISSSHNTYLLAHQLYGTSSALAYETALKTGARCVEIDAWDNDEDKDEPKVTHGYTLASHIPFRKVCEAIRDAVDQEAARTQLESGYGSAPILLSLENHCTAHGQLRLVEIMREVWGERLLSKAVRDEGTREQQESGEHVTLQDLGSKIALIVEYHLPDEEENSESSSDEDEDPQVRRDHAKYKEQKKQNPAMGIIPELAELGVYAQSVKPKNNSWFEGQLRHGPHHHLINVSESGLIGLMPEYSSRISQHNSQHLMRVFPKGTRISSRNLNPVPFWGIGAQICALNWQTFDHSMQLNEALFAGSDGYVLKPKALRAGGDGKLDTGKKVTLRLHIAGATDLPIPEDRDAEEIRPYVTCTLVHPGDLEEHPKRKTAAYKQHKLQLLHKGENPPNTDPLWGETLEWDFEDNEMTFLRILIKSDDRFARNPVFVVAAVRLLYVTSGWSFIRMLDLKGRETHCSLLVKFDLEEGSKLSHSRGMAGHG